MERMAASRTLILLEGVFLAALSRGGIGLPPHPTRAKRYSTGYLDHGQAPIRTGFPYGAVVLSHNALHRRNRRTLSQKNSPGVINNMSSGEFTCNMYIPRVS